MINSLKILKDFCKIFIVVIYKFCGVIALFCVPDTDSRHKHLHFLVQKHLKNHWTKKTNKQKKKTKQNKTKQNSRNRLVGMAS